MLVTVIAVVPPQTCSSVECWRLQCDVGLLERGASVILSVRSRLWAETFVEVRRQFRFALHKIHVVEETPGKLTQCVHWFAYTALCWSLWNHNDMTGPQYSLTQYYYNIYYIISILYQQLSASDN